jgi:replication initiation protein RepC
MHRHPITTPFGRGAIKLAHVSRQIETANARQGLIVDKWKVFRDVCEARLLIGIPDRALTVLDALLSFYPHAELSEDAGLVVFPSNAQLSLRAHGMADATLRRHLALLIEVGLIVRKDSPNGKRYAHKGRDGSIEDAFGFSLAPLLARRDELALLAQQVVADRRRFALAKEALTICRRDIRKLISAALEEGADGDWQRLEDRYLQIVARLPRTLSIQIIESCLNELNDLRDDVSNLLETSLVSGNMSGNAAENERHIQNSNTESIHELEPSSGKEQGEKSRPESRPQSETLKAFPLGMVLKACPQVVDYGPGGVIGGWRDLMQAAVVVRSMLGISASAYQEACEVMGAENAAVAVAAILERAGHINSAGGYLRDLTRRARRGEFSLGPMIMALLRANGEARLATG